jgi:hypothetical protein
MAAIVPHATSDETGHFAIPHLWLRKYAVAAEKKGEDYPNMSMQFSSDGTFETIILISRHSAASVSNRLGPKAGVLVGTIADRVTGAPLNPCVDFRWASQPNNFLAGTGLVNAKDRALVPYNTDGMIKIGHEGYKPWYYPGTVDKSQSTPVRLKPGEEQILDIRWQPRRDAAEQGCGMPVGTGIKP